MSPRTSAVVATFAFVAEMKPHHGDHSAWVREVTARFPRVWAALEGAMTDAA